MAGKFEIYTSSNGEYRFRLKSSNGQNILASEGYKSAAGCNNGIESVRKNARLPERFERKESKSGKHHFVLKSGNHQVIGASQMYADAKGMENGIKSVMKNAPDAKVVEV